MKTIDVKQLEEMLITVSKPGRYMGNEWNVTKKDLEKVDVKFALAFPDIYDVGMSYLGFRIIYGVLNSREDIACERVFAPWVDFEERIRQKEIPLFSLESKVPIRDFDIIGFSLTYELNYTNVLNMLDMANIPLKGKERKGDFPLIIAGGPCAFNPAPMSKFIDAFVVGDGEEAVLEVVDVYKKVTSNEKEMVLKELAKIEGVYVPAFPREVKKRIVNDLDKVFYPTREMVPYVQIIHDRITLEIMRGCPFGCKFCQAGSIYKPVRMRSKERILQLARDIYKNTGYDEISLLSLSSSSYPDIASLILGLTDAFKDLGVGISLPSLRSEDILKALPSLIAKVRKTGLTFAIEAGSDRLRKYINKDIDIEKVILACGEAFKAGWRLVKFYFMIGLPTETNEDLEGVVDFVYKVLRLSKVAEISVSITGFVPKVETSFQNENMESIETLKAKQKFLKERLKNKRIKLKFHEAGLTSLEGRLSRPDRNLSEAIFKAWQRGARLEAWSEFFKFEIWGEVLA
jgi:radical SAM superfamily enzyme YgiQ (UPF0313 family)